MKFLYPTAFFFAASIPVVILFYLLKRRRVSRIVPSTLLWQKFLAETQASSPFQKLRHNWLLILQILLLALSRPYLSSEEKQGGIRILILDASASMRSRDVEGSRFEQAKTEALEWLSGLKDTDQTVVISASGQTVVRLSPTSVKATVGRVIRRMDAGDGPTRLREALKLSETLILNQMNAEVHLFSDGGISEDLSEFESKGLPLVFHKIGVRSNNQAIVKMDVRSNPDDASQRALFTEIANYSDSVIECNVELQFEKDVIEVRSVSIESMKSTPLIFLADQQTNGVFTLSLNIEDDLESDNTASVVSLLPKTLRALLLSSGNYLLEKVIRSAGNVELSVTSDPTAVDDSYDLVILDNLSPIEWPAQNLIALNVLPPGWFETSERVEVPVVIPWKKSHPLLRWVTFENVQIAEAWKVNSPSWADSILDSSEHPLIFAGEEKGVRRIWIGFDPLESTWPLRFSYPIFFKNAIEWLSPEAGREKQLTIRTGDPFRWPIDRTNKETPEVLLPNGVTRILKVNTNAIEVVFGDTLAQGHYELKQGNSVTRFVANLTNAEESDIMPRSELNFGERLKIEGSQIKQASLEKWRWIAAVGLFFLLFEWWFYHKRTV
ncbi:MAG TPA: VWA domain-containing protein [Verrucomicrobiales bacterium]|nr:VWA domain-containing protein [Verrucomicrobiales bacterium]